MADIDQKGFDKLLASTPAGARSVTIETEDAGTIQIQIRPVPPLKVLQVLKDYVTAADIFSVLVAGTADDIAAGSVATMLFDEAPEALGEIIVLATGETEGVKDKAHRLLSERSLLEVSLLGEAVVEATMPKGVSDFFGRMKVLAEKRGWFRK